MLEQSLDKSKLERGDYSQIRSLAEKIKTDFADREQKFRNLIETIPATITTGAKAIQISDSELEASTKIALQKILSFGPVRVQTRINSKADGIHSFLGKLEPVHLAFTLPHSETKPLSVNGSVEELSLLVPLANLPVAERIGIFWKGISYFKDKYENNIIITEAPSYLSFKEELAKVSIRFKIPFTDTPTDQFKVPLSFDLTQIGMGEIRNLFQVNNNQPVGTFGNWKIYSDDKTLEVETITNQLQGIANGSKRITDLFGISNESIISRIYVSSTNDNEFEVKARSPEVIFIENNPDASSTENSIVGAHETLHAMDLALGRVSEGKIRALWEELSKDHQDFLSAISEDNFLPGSRKTGHAWESEHEFFASFCNSLLHPQLENALAHATPEFRALYMRTLKVVKKELISAGVPASAAIINKIERVKGFLSPLSEAIVPPKNLPRKGQQPPTGIEPVT